MPTADFDSYLRTVTERESEKPLFDAARARVELGLQLSRLRAQHGLTQQQLAAESGIPQSEVSRIEGGRANPTVKTLSALGGVLGAELTWSPVQAA